ncbi:hypothetical protein EDM53_01725 [Rickettsiales endosymbiont of Peranema trichophorum]|uniref:hypothetical protein n=1 Tax=Rickettsiales endosymbiont of Peranema trichophorum TaxID=2486577 RepID=UPI00102304A4|nr:hypothetical protein [Rickettsiales endosymbiont of Peranema trichophorum]RZI47451.1 hypothetical protein EDM53_01725 [Rickettsiales endosymbiont of Peranema trichophorum]
MASKQDGVSPRIVCAIATDQSGSLPNALNDISIESVGTLASILEAVHKICYVMVRHQKEWVDTGMGPLWHLERTGLEAVNRNSKVHDGMKLLIKVLQDVHINQRYELMGRYIKYLDKDVSQKIIENLTPLLERKDLGREGLGKVQNKQGLTYIDKQVKRTGYDQEVARSVLECILKNRFEEGEDILSVIHKYVEQMLFGTVGSSDNVEGNALKTGGQEDPYSYNEEEDDDVRSVGEFGPPVGTQQVQSVCCVAMFVRLVYTDPVLNMISSPVGTALLDKAYDLGGETFYYALLDKMYDKDRAEALLSRASLIGSAQLVSELLEVLEGAKGEVPSMALSTTLGGGKEYVQQTTTAPVIITRSNIISSVMNGIAVLKNKFNLLPVHEATQVKLVDAGQYTTEMVQTEEMMFAMNQVHYPRLDGDTGAVTLEYIQDVVYKTAIGVKVADTIVDVLRVVNHPTIYNVKKVLLDTVHIYSMYTCLGLYTITVGGLEVSYQLHQGEYTEALKQIAIMGSYVALNVALHLAIAAPGLQYVGLTFAMGITFCGAYQAMFNAHDLYAEYTSEYNAIKSASAYAELYELLAHSPLQYVYDFGAKELMEGLYSECEHSEL